MQVTIEQVPRVQLEAIGPAMVLRVRRHQFPAPDLWALACKQPKQCVVVLFPRRDATVSQPLSAPQDHADEGEERLDE